MHAKSGSAASAARHASRETELNMLTMSNRRSARDECSGEGMYCSSWAKVEWMMKSMPPGVFTPNWP